MKSASRVLLVLSAMSLACNASAFAAASNVAALSDVNGKVLINQGKGFVKAAAQNKLNIGDKIMVGMNASANIDFGTCLLTIAKPTVYTVTKVVPCAIGEKTAQIGNVFVSPANWHGFALFGWGAHGSMLPGFVIGTYGLTFSTLAFKTFASLP